MPLRRTLLVAASLFAALWCLMLLGGGRLIVSDASPNEPARAERPVAVPVMPGATSQDPSGMQSPPMRAAQAESPREARANRETQGALSAPGLARDANGNVLRAGRYMREAYRAFALEDAGG